jgi:bacteriorhodopsin
MNIDKKTEEEEKKEITKNKFIYIKMSFTITYILLLTTALITFIEAMRTNVPVIRHIFNLETSISLVASYFYSVFVAKIDEIEKNNKAIDWNDLTRIRYIDWAITTPMMLLVLSVVLSYGSKIAVKIITVLTIIALNYIMLISGYLGEINVISRLQGLIVGFIAFFAMFFTIFINFIKPKYDYTNYMLFGIYIVVWSIYGIVYMFNQANKNIIMNILDCIAKCFVGIFLWVYYTELIKF